MKLIPLTQGKFAQVDDEDYDFLMQWKWYAKYLGVSKDIYIRVNGVEKNKWKAVIQVNDKHKHLGRFPFTPCGELLAAVTYDSAAENNHGRFANLNFKSLWPRI